MYVFDDFIAFVLRQEGGKRKGLKGKEDNRRGFRLPFPPFMKREQRR